MVSVNISTLGQYQSDVIDELTTRYGITAEGWHSGGGIFGVLITLPSKATLFSTLERDGDPSWLMFDWMDPNGDHIGSIESPDARPYGTSEKWGGTATVNEMAAAINKVVSNLR